MESYYVSACEKPWKNSKATQGDGGEAAMPQATTGSQKSEGEVVGLVRMSALDKISLKSKEAQPASRQKYYGIFVIGMLLVVLFLVAVISTSAKPSKARLVSTHSYASSATPVKRPESVSTTYVRRGASVQTDITSIDQEATKGLEEQEPTTRLHQETQVRTGSAANLSEVATSPPSATLLSIGRR